MPAGEGSGDYGGIKIFSNVIAILIKRAIAFAAIARFAFTMFVKITLFNIVHIFEARLLVKQHTYVRALNHSNDPEDNG